MFNFIIIVLNSFRSTPDFGAFSSALPGYKESRFHNEECGHLREPLRDMDPEPDQIHFALVKVGNLYLFWRESWKYESRAFFLLERQMQGGKTTQQMVPRWWIRDGCTGCHRQWV